MSLLTPMAAEALAAAEVVVGYSGYLDGIADLVAGKECLSFPLGDEVLRAQVALERRRRGGRCASSRAAIRASMRWRGWCWR